MIMIMCKSRGYTGPEGEVTQAAQKQEFSMANICERRGHIFHMVGGVPLPVVRDHNTLSMPHIFMRTQRTDTSAVHWATEAWPRDRPCMPIQKTYSSQVQGTEEEELRGRLRIHILTASSNEALRTGTLEARGQLSLRRAKYLLKAESKIDMSESGCLLTSRRVKPAAFSNLIFIRTHKWYGNGFQFNVEIKLQPHLLHSPSQPITAHYNPRKTLPFIPTANDRSSILSFLEANQASPKLKP